MASPWPAVQENLSVTTAIIGLLAVGGKTIDTLWDLNTPADRKSGAVCVQALQEIKQCRSTVHVLYKTLSLLESAQLPSPERGAWISVDHLVAILTDTVLAMSELQAGCEALSLEKLGLVTPPPSSSEPRGQRQRQQPEEENPPHGVGASCASPRQKAIEGLCSRIRWHNLSMTMMMTILKCPGESDAQNSRVGLERRMKRLLSANTNLSARMRRLDDFLRQARFWASPRLTPYPGTTAALASRDAPPDEADSDGARRHPPSPMSGYTLADIPVLSMIPLPVTTGELTDGTLFYTFAYARLVGRDLGELMQSQAGQGTSRSLGVILGRTNTAAENGASSTSTGGSSDVGPVVVGGQTQAGADHVPSKFTRWRVRDLSVRRRWRG
ncbi:hypothetical protein E4U42_001777 [Claviceps africana]|uniref:Uncharacterized protein n=1 Tax=Claviceps africana TaxID=83212 RepID=A0A8K0NJ25_9HYPO|nr:hypothetical protein E4U42_001777 [Claviceps africana]